MAEAHQATNESHSSWTQPILWYQSKQPTGLAPMERNSLTASARSSVHICDGSVISTPMRLHERSDATHFDGSVVGTRGQH